LFISTKLLSSKDFLQSDLLLIPTHDKSEHFVFLFCFFSTLSYLLQRWIISMPVLECLDFAKENSSVLSWFVSIFSLFLFYVMFSSQFDCFLYLWHFNHLIFCVFNRRVKERDMSQRNYGNEIKWIRGKSWVLLICNANTLSWVNSKHMCSVWKYPFKLANWIYWFN
jgi:hypothetical protein